MIEPAAYGIPVSFGPHTSNFRDIVSALLTAQAAIVVRNEADLQRFVKRGLTDRRWAQRLGQNAQQEIRRHLGASNRTVSELERLLPPTSPDHG